MRSGVGPLDYRRSWRVAGDGGRRSCSSAWTAGRGMRLRFRYRSWIMLHGRTRLWIAPGGSFDGQWSGREAARGRVGVLRRSVQVHMYSTISLEKVGSKDRQE